MDDFLAMVAPEATLKGVARLLRRVAALRVVESEGVLVAAGVGHLEDTWESQSGKGCMLVWLGEVDDSDLLNARLGLPASAPTGAALMRGWQRWGPSMLDHVDGPLAVAVVEEGRPRVWAGREYFGRIPLWFATPTDATVIVTTNPQLIWRTGLLRVQAELESLRRFIRAENPSLNKDFFRGVHRLRAGEWRAWDRDRSFRDGSVRRASGGGNLCRTEAALALRRTLRETASNIDVSRSALMMSGGLDSTAIAAALRQVHPHQQVRSGTMVFPGFPAQNEAAAAKTVAQQLRLEAHHYDMVSHWRRGVLEQVMQRPSFGPVYNPTEVYQPYFLRSMKEMWRIEAVLSGTGGDQIFATSREAALGWAANRRQWSRLAELEPTLSEIVRLVGRPAAQRMGLLVPARRLHTRLKALGAADSVASATTAWVLPRTGSDEPVAVLTAESKYQRWSWELPMRAMRRRSLEAGLMIRLPLVDRRLLSIMSAVPAPDVWRRGLNKGTLRDALAGWLPEPVRQLRKTVSFDRFLQFGILEQDYALVRSIFEEARLGQVGLIDSGAFVERLEHARRQHTAGKLVGLFWIWPTVAAEFWLRALESQYPVV